MLVCTLKCCNEKIKPLSILLQVVKQCVATEGVEPSYIREAGWLLRSFVLRCAEKSDESVRKLMECKMNFQLSQLSRP